MDVPFSFCGAGGGLRHAREPGRSGVSPVWTARRRSHPQFGFSSDPPEGQEEADARLRKNHGVVASFSRALLEGLSVHQTDAQFNAMLDASIERIYEASIT